jgi:hypothetical protein
MLVYICQLFAIPDFIFLLFITNYKFKQQQTNLQLFHESFITIPNINR